MRAGWAEAMDDETFVGELVLVGFWGYRGIADSYAHRGLHLLPLRRRAGGRNAHTGPHVQGALAQCSALVCHRSTDKLHASVGPKKQGFVQLYELQTSASPVLPSSLLHPPLAELLGG